MPRPFMHLQASGGPWGRRKRFRRSVAQWLEHRSPNSALAIPIHPSACYFIRFFGDISRLAAYRHAGPCYPVPSNWVAKW
jgi:hypothetical protein